jgi:CDP-diacylglycerol--serine O-phosphatidyltransferase
MKHRRIPAGKLKELPAARLIPNIVTLLGLCAGITAIKFALAGNWQGAAAAIMIASLFDVLDGGMARLLGVNSSFGAELDSLTDMVSFGVAPAVLLYTWVMHDAGTLGWALILLFCICCALRLARFNTDLGDDDRPAWSYRYFTGIPTPAGAGIVMLPLALSFNFGTEFFGHVLLNAAVIVFASLMMVGRVPTFSLKRIRVAHRFVVPVLLGVCLLAACLVGSPWMTLSVLGIMYLLSLPLSWRAYRRRLAREAANPVETAEPENAPADDPSTSQP